MSSLTLTVFSQKLVSEKSPTYLEINAFLSMYQKEKSQRKLEYSELIKDTTLSKFVGLPKAVCSGKFTALNAYIRKGNKSQTNILRL